MLLPRFRSVWVSLGPPTRLSEHLKMSPSWHLDLDTLVGPQRRCRQANLSPRMAGELLSPFVCLSSVLLYLYVCSLISIFPAKK